MSEIEFPSSKEVMPFYCKAMAKAYPSDGEYEDGPFPGWKTFTYREGNLMLTDTYWTTPGSNKSGGVTMVYYKDIPIWEMHYGGTYEPEAIPTLKKAMLHNLERGIFIGGRGPSLFEDGDNTYENTPKGTGKDFEIAYGAEYIENTAAREWLGTHWYQVLWLVND